MRIHLFNDKTGVIHGIDSRNLIADKCGTLLIGGKKIPVFDSRLTALPAILDSTYMAKFEGCDGVIYHIGSVAIHNGGLVSNKSYTERELALRHALDEAEVRIAELTERVDALEKIFDTDSLNFLITPDAEPENIEIA